MTRALVLFSGGQDSTTTLAWALTQFTHVETIGFNYGQRHEVELACRPTLLQKMRALKPDWDQHLHEDHVFSLPTLSQISETSLTREIAFEWQANGLPNTFVPGRNLLFFTYATALAYRRDLPHLVGGMCETDYSGYPDCRDETLKALQVALSLGMGRDFTLHTPLMWQNKAQTWQFANEIGGQALVDLIVEETHSCYLGTRGERHVWGYGCGACPACELRRQGYEGWGGGNASHANVVATGS